MDESSESGQRNGRPKSPNAPEEFQRFEDLARKLTQVPKSAIDAKRNGSKQPSPSTRRK